MVEISFGKEHRAEVKKQDDNAKRRISNNPVKERKRRPVYKKFPTKWMTRCFEAFKTRAIFHTPTTDVLLTKRALQIYATGVSCQIAGLQLAMEYNLYHKARDSRTRIEELESIPGFHDLYEQSQKHEQSQKQEKKRGP